jgi:mannosylfructose-phosphate synthase
MSSSSANGKRIMMILPRDQVSAETHIDGPHITSRVDYVMELSKSLARIGYSVDIFTCQFKDQSATDPVSDRVRILRFPCGRADLIPKDTLWELAPEWVANVQSFVESEQLEYRFVNSHCWNAGLAGQALADKLGLPHLHVAHSVGTCERDDTRGVEKETTRHEGFARRIDVESAIYKSCNAVVVATPRQNRTLASDEYGISRDKVYVIPGGYDDARFFPVSAATRYAVKQKLGMDGPTVLALDCLIPGKREELVVRAMPTVLRHVSNARLVLPTDWHATRRRELEQAERLWLVARDLEVDNHVEFRGCVTEQELPDYYQATDVFALSSRRVPVSMAAIEAMACGAAIVITTESDLRELIHSGENAMCASPRDPEEFGEAIAAVLTNPRLEERLSERGVQTALKRFTWNGVAQQILNVLREIEPKANKPSARDPFDNVLGSSDTAKL